jgi:large subunit ribosomal protein L29
MKTAEIKELSVKEIQERIDVEVATLVKLKLNHTVSPLDNPMTIRRSRRNIARLKTILQQRNS